MNKSELTAYLEKIDDALRAPATLFIYGSAAFILLDEPDRTSLDIDIAGPYSQADEADFRRAATAAGVPVNPGEEYNGAHIEWVSPLRLCLQRPIPGTEILLWQGAKLCVQTVPVPELIASKLIRYDAIDRMDVQYLLAQTHTPLTLIEAAAKRLPEPFASDPLVTENLENLRADIALWSRSSHDPS